MNSKPNSLQRIIWLTGVIMLLGALLAAQCNHQPSTPPTAEVPTPVISDLNTSLASNELLPSKEMRAWVNASVSNPETPIAYKWDLEGGEIKQGQGTAKIIYKAPDLPGVYEVKLVVECGDWKAERSTRIIVPTPTLTYTTTYTPVPPTDNPDPTYTPVLPTDTPGLTDTLALPTDTPGPTDTPHPSPTPTIGISIAEVPPTLTLPPSPLPPTPVITSPPTLLEPQDETSTGEIRLDLSWDWPGTLGPDDYFRVEIWNRYHVFYEFDDSVPTIDVAWVKKKSYVYDKIEEAYDREYRWRITVIRGTPAGEKQWSTPENRVWEPSSQFEEISEPSKMRTLYVDPGIGPVSDPGPEPTEPSGGGGD